jgi:hypothetical protein
MTTVATQCEVVKFNIDPRTWSVQTTITKSDPNILAVSFESNEDCTLLFMNPAIFGMESLFLDGGPAKELKVVATGQTEVKVLASGTTTSAPEVRLRVQVCGGPKIIIP